MRFPRAAGDSFAALLIAAATFAVFSPALSNGFVNWDDPRHFLFNQDYRGLGWRHLRWMLTTVYNANYQPLSWVTLGLDYVLWGLDPKGYHLTNIVLHSLTAAAFYCLAKLLIQSASPAWGERDARIGAALAALFFAVHPLRVESVAWISERRDVLSGVFYVLALWAYARRRLGLALACYASSLLSKGMGVTLPATLLLLDVYPLRRIPADPRRWLEPRWRPIWLEKAPFALLAIAAGAVGFWAQARFGPVRTIEQFGLLERAAVASFGLAFYPWKTLWPIELLPLYELPQVLVPWSRPYVLSFTAVVLATAAATASSRRWPALAAAWISYAIALAPVSGLVQFGSQIAADRYSYIPCMSFAVVAGGGFVWLRRRLSNAGGRAALALAALVLCGFCALTVAQTKVWRDSESLWGHVLAARPDHIGAHASLGFTLVETGRLDEGTSHLERVLRLTTRADQNYVAAHYQLGKALLIKGRLDEALLHLREARRADPSHADVLNNIGNVLMLQRRFADAAEHYREALRLKPQHAGARSNLAIALARGRRG